MSSKNDRLNDMTEFDPSRDEELAALLPFYLNGGLERADHKRVASWIMDSKTGRRAYQTALEEQQALVLDNESTKVPAGALGRLMEQVAAEPKTASTAQSLRGWLAKAWGWFERAPATLAWGMSAALLLIAVGQGVLLMGQGTAPGPGFETASGGNSSEGGVMLMIRFVPEASIKDISDELAARKALIVSGPKGKELYMVRMSGAKGEADLEQRLARLRQRHDLFKLVIRKKGRP